MSIALNGDGIISGVSSITVGAGASVFSPAANTLALGTNGSERVRVDSSGNFGVGTVPKTWSGFTALEVSEASIVSSGTGDAFFSANSYYDGAWKYKDTGVARNIYMNSDGIVFRQAASGSADAAISWTEAARFNTSGNLAFPSGQGIDFSATANSSGTMTSELLSDYEEGTFTPVLSDASSAGNTTTGGTVYGYYLKVGRLVTCTIGGYSFSTSGMTAGNTFYVQGLPFQCQATGPVVRHVGAVTAERCNGSTNSMTFQVVENQVYGLFVQNGETGASARTVIVSDFSTGNSYFRTTIAYFAQ